MNGKGTCYCILNLFLFFLLIATDSRRVVGQHSEHFQDDILIKVNQSLTRLRIQINNDSSRCDSTKVLSIQKKLGKVNYLLNGLIDKLLMPGCRHDAPYYKMLKEISNYKDLFGLSLRTKNYDSLDAVISFIADDLNLKYDPQYASSTDNNVELMPVRIHVFKKNTSIQLGGFICRVKPEWSLNENQVETFNPTNNAFKKIAPGRKLFWIEKKGVVLEKRSESVRLENSNTEIVIDFIVN